MNNTNDVISGQGVLMADQDYKDLSYIETYCKQRGIRFTSIRKHVLQLIWDSRSAVKAYDLLEQVKTDFKTATPTTVYRALDFLLEQGFIHRVMSLNAFIACKHLGCSDDRMLLICTQCHEIEERPADEMINGMTHEIKRAGFIKQINSIEIQGLCTHCNTY